MKKSELRKYYKEKRKSLTDREEKSARIQKLLLENFVLEHKMISVFIPIEKFAEVNTWHILDSNLNTSFCVPKMKIEKKEIVHFLYENKNNLTQNKWGILEPENGKVIEPKDIDVVLVPLLILNSKGQRVGYGGGYYDRFLAKCKPETLKIGLSFFDPIDLIEDLNEFDFPLDIGISPNKVYDFR